MLTINTFRWLFRLSVTAFFLYEAVLVVVHYLDYQTVSQEKFERQETQPPPMVCVASPYFGEGRLEEIEIDIKQYQKNGTWTTKLNTNNEETVYDFISPKLSDILEKISVRRRTDYLTDNYENVEFLPDELDEELGPEGLTILRMDYYDEFKIYCLNISSNLQGFGVETVYLFSKDIKYNMVIIEPGNFYSFARKRNLVKVQPKRDYHIQVYHDLHVSLSLDQSPCFPEMKEKVDQCRLKYINDAIVNKFNCTTPWLLHYARAQNATMTICSLASGKRAEASQMFYNMRYTPSNICKKPCTNMKIRSIVSGNIESNNSYVAMTFSKKIPVFTEVLETSFLLVVAEIGGFLGLFLGLSILNLEPFIADAILSGTTGWKTFRKNQKMAARRRLSYGI